MVDFRMSVRRAAKPRCSGLHGAGRIRLTKPPSQHWRGQAGSAPEAVSLTARAADGPQIVGEREDDVRLVDRRLLQQQRPAGLGERQARHHQQDQKHGKDSTHDLPPSMKTCGEWVHLLWPPTASPYRVPARFHGTVREGGNR